MLQNAASDQVNTVCIPGTPTTVNGHTEILKMDKSTGKKWAKNSGSCLKSLNLTCMYVSHM